MKLATLAVILTGCAYEPPPTYQSHMASIGRAPDPAAAIVLQCDRLGFSGQAHRLCVMRGVDRLAIVAAPVANSVGTAAPIQILPFAYPPLVPQGTVFVR